REDEAVTPRFPAEGQGALSETTRTIEHAPVTAVPADAADGRHSLDPILRPRSIAVLGASRTPGTIGHQVVANLQRYGFHGPVYPVNPNAQAVCSIRSAPSIGAIPDPVDLAVIVVPKQHVVEAAIECGEKGVRGLVVISAGFREIGGEGVVRERQLMDVVRRYGIRLIGPNCLGVLNADPAISMNATFAPVMPPSGKVAFVSQSGALGLSVLDYAREYGIGIAQFVSIGNRPDVSSNDLLAYWENDPSVAVILMYVESFGNPRRFLEIAGRITKRKPIVLVKSGRSKAGARAASSHTGALAGSDSAVDALLAQAGVFRAETVEELFELAIGLEAYPLPRSRRTAVVTNAGGPGILAADALEARGLELPGFTPETEGKLRALLPEEASVRNPVDMIASASAEAYRQVLDVVLTDPGIDSAIAVFVPPVATRQSDVVDAIVRASAHRGAKPVLAVLMGRDGLPEGRAELRQCGVPAYMFPESAARALAALVRHRDWAALPSLPAESPAVDRAAAARILEQVFASGRRALLDEEPFAVLEAYGIPAVASRRAATADAAVAAAEEVGFPVALKVVSDRILHKSDIGGVRVGLRGPEEVREAYADITAAGARAVPDAPPEGVLVQQMGGEGRELIVGLARDPSFGPLIMFGLGGVLAEAIQDVVFRLAPLDRRIAGEMVRGIRAARLLQAFRGQPPVDLVAVEDVLLRVSRLALDFPEIDELDLNPVLASDRGAIALDARIILRAAPGEG
ncbi:MAG TPA: acetate--CoA ligase family protein, partial [Gemmatimonadales bacterium]|nr:acetate--CoA ligase family protein [Gemmatimonadales bacterium]